MTTDELYIGKYRLELTCAGCPEQYDVFLEDEQVGYLRLRHGYFRVEFPNCRGELIYKASPKGDGMFNEDEREFYLNEAISAIDAKLNER